MLKLPYRWAIICVLQGVTGLAAAGVLLEKVTYPGFVRQEDAISTRCTLHDDGLMTMQYQLGSLKSLHKQTLQLNTAAIKQNIDIAALAPMSSAIFPVDANTQIYRAYQKKAGAVKTVVLFEQNGGTGEEKTNGSSEALMLRHFIDLNCGKPSLQ
jgi:hypothetical protein